MIVLYVLAGSLLLIAAHDLIRRPLIRRQALRNLTRRPTESAIVVAGALLGTAIITASFVIGDTIDHSIRDIARTELGPIDVTVVVDDDQLEPVRTRLEASPIAGTDGMLATRTVSAVVATVGGETTRAEPSARVYELDFDHARSFGGDVAATGFADVGATPRPGEATISRSVADSLDITVGDDIDVHVYGAAHRLHVVDITPQLGVAGRGVENVHVGPGTLATWFAAAAGANHAAPIDLIYVSATGGVFEGADGSGAITADLRARLAGLPDVEVGQWKAELLEEAELEGRELTTVFSGIGSFAIISGILLLVNIVVMLTEERRTQLGVCRAIGMRRLQLVRTMGLEGTGYAVLATPIGLAAGVVVGWIAGLMASSLLADDGLTLEFAVDAQSLVIGGLVGLLITLGTVWLASLRLVRMNVIAAIRDLPEPARRGAVWRRLAVSVAIIGLGSLLLFAGIDGDSAIPALVGVPLIAAGAAPVLTQLLGSRLAITLAGAVGLFWGVAVFTILPEAMKAPDIEVFVFQGVVLVAASVGVLTVNSSVWQHVARRASSGAKGVPVRLGLTYPLARPDGAPARHVFAGDLHHQLHGGHRCGVQQPIGRTRSTSGRWPRGHRRRLPDESTNCGDVARHRWSDGRISVDAGLGRRRGTRGVHGRSADRLRSTPHRWRRPRAELVRQHV